MHKNDQREEMVAEGRRTEESETMLAGARDGVGMDEDHRGTTPPAEAQNQATAPPGNGPLNESALASGLDRLEQAGAGH